MVLNIYFNQYLYIIMADSYLQKSYVVDQTHFIKHAFSIKRHVTKINS